MPLVDSVTMSAKGTVSPAALHPVAVFDTPLAKGLAAGRPALLLALLALRFNSLVAEPLSTLQTALPIVAAVQAAYVVLGLPGAGTQTAKPSKKARPGEKKRTEGTGPNPIVTTVLSLLLTALATPVVYVLLVLFGAPFLDYTSHTMLCAAHFSLLALFPTFYARGVDGHALLAVAGASAPLDETFGALLGAVLGAWLGAVPIPLDWDREWQKWPVTIVAGMYAGSCLGSQIAGFLFYGKRLAASKASE